MYKYKNKEYETMNDMLKAWDADGANRHYSLQIGKHKYEATYLSLDELTKELKRNNNCYTFYKNSNKGYNYKDASKIVIDNVDRIEIRNNKGIYGNITNAFRVITYNGKYVRLD